MVFPAAFWDAPRFQAHFLFSAQDRFPRAEMLRLSSQFCKRHWPCCVVGYAGWRGKGAAVRSWGAGYDGETIDGRQDADAKFPSLVFKSSS